MDTISLKKYIYDNQKIEFVLDEIGCKNIKYHDNKEFYSCSNYNGDNVGAVNVKNNQYLNVVNWTRQKEFDDNSDIITLVEYNKNISFLEAVKYLLNDYIPLLYIGWLREGVMPWTAKKFGLAYSYKRKRVIIPMRYWITGELLGINSRTTVENYEELGIKKFFITPSYQKSLNLFGLYENYDSIQKAKQVTVVEAEKSVLKRDSLNDSTLVALSGHTMSEEQAAILIGLNVDIVIALDKDVPIEEVWDICEKFYNKRNVYYIQDKWDLLKEKDSPADAKNKIYNFLMKYKVKYDAEHHRKYLKSLQK